MENGGQVVVDNEEGVIWEPAESKDDHHDNHHFNNLRFVVGGWSFVLVTYYTTYSTIHILHTLIHIYIYIYICNETHLLLGHYCSALLFYVLANRLVTPKLLADSIVKDGHSENGKQVSDDQN